MPSLPVILILLPLAAVFALLIAGWCRHECEWGSIWLNCLDGINRLYCNHYHRLKAHGISLPITGPVLVAANHVSGLDPLLMLAATARPLRFLVAREEFERAEFSWLLKAVGCIPVDRASAPDRALRTALRTLQNGEAIALFPSGRIHLDEHHPTRLKAGVLWLARQANCPIYPLHLHGIAGEGKVLPALLHRSKARITASQLIDPMACTEKECRHLLAGIFNGSIT